MDVLVPAGREGAVGGGLRALGGAGGLPSAAELRERKAAMDSAAAPSGADPADDPLEEPGIKARLTASLSLKKYY